MAVKHTPAPWQSNTWKHEYARDGFETVITDSRGHGIVSFHQYGESEKVTANARLIAESPTMFEALQAVAALDWFPHSDDPGECPSMCPVCQALDLVINSITAVEGG